MFALLRTSLRFFIVGFVVGTLFAPRAGAETRQMLREKFTVIANQILEIAAQRYHRAHAIIQEIGELDLFPRFVQHLTMRQADSLQVRADQVKFFIGNR